MTDTLLFLDIETADAPDEEWNAFVAGYPEHYDEEPDRSRSALTTLARVTSIGFTIGDDEVQVVYDQPIRDLLSGVRDYVMSKTRALPWVVTWNGEGFDLPILQQACLRIGEPVWATLYGGPLRSKPWERRSIDLLKLWPEVRRPQPGHSRMQEVCRRMGIAPQDGPLGAEMADAYARGDWKAIVEHQRADVEQLRALYWKMAPVLGKAG